MKGREVMSFSKCISLNGSDVDFRLIDKPKYRKFSNLLNKILIKYGCRSEINRQFLITEVSSTVQESIALFDECFNSQALYDYISFFATGIAAGKTKQLRIIVSFNFVGSRQACIVELTGHGFSEAIQNNILDTISSFIYRASKIKLATQKSKNVSQDTSINNRTDDSADQAPTEIVEKKKHNKSKPSADVRIKIVTALIALATAIIGMIASIIEKFF